SAASREIPHPRDAIAPPPDPEGEQAGLAEADVALPRPDPLPSIGQHGGRARAARPAQSPYESLGGGRSSPVPSSAPSASVVISDATLAAIEPKDVKSSSPPDQPRDGSSLPSALPSLKLEHYAALCAELSVGAVPFEQALLRYGIVDRDLWQAVD